MRVPPIIPSIPLLQSLTTALPISKPSVAAHLHSIKNRASLPSHSKTLHFIRHAEGTHNVNNEYRLPSNLDAELTGAGITQCLELRKRHAELIGTVECVVSSVMTRTLQTALFSFEDVILSIPVVACEDWRETVNYICDKRRDTSLLRAAFPTVDFGPVLDEEDPVWKHYETIYGDQYEYLKGRESVDEKHLEERARRAWKFIEERPEREIAIVAHSAIFMHMFTRMDGVVSYEDEAVKDLLKERFLNCELRSVAFMPPTSQGE